MNLRLLLLILIGYVFLQSCRCQQYQCPAFDDADRTYFPYQLGNTFSYTNNSGNSIIFTADSIYTNPASTQRFSGNGDFGCSTDTFCDRYAAFVAHSNVSRNSTNRFAIRLNGNIGTCSVFGEIDDFDFHNSIGLSVPGDSLLPTLTLGNHTYNNVLVITKDTTTNKYQTALNAPQLWKIYLTHDQGLVGFWDRPTQSLFYLP